MFEKRRDNNPTAASGQVTSPNRVAPSMRAEAASQAQTMIGPTIVINGKLSGDGDIVVAGTIEGQVDLPSNSVTIASGGHAYANMTANVIEVEGEVQGDIFGNDKVLIARTGRMEGNIVSSRVILEDGAVFKGSIDIKEAGPVPAKADAGVPGPVAKAASNAGGKGKPAAGQGKPVAAGSKHAG